MRECLVVIPTYNEIENIEAIIRKVFSLRDGEPDCPFDLLIVDDGSPDGTAQVVRDLQLEMADTSSVARLHVLERKGKLGLGTAYLDGFKWGMARGYNYFFEMDADFSHNPDDLIRLYHACANGTLNDSGKQLPAADVAVGSRYIKGVNVVNWPMGRVLMSYFAGVYVRNVTGMPIMDPTAGFVCYTRRVLDTILQNRIRFVGYAFQIEMKFTCWKYGFRLVEVPIIFTDRTRGTSKMSTNIFKEAVFGVLQMKVGSFFRHYIPGRSALATEPEKAII